MLQAVRLRLRREQIGSAARSAAWLTVAVALIALLLHAFVRPVQAGGVALVVAFTWLLAIAQAILRPIDTRSCAGRADRVLDGASAYETYLEGRDSADHDNPAWRRLVELLEQVAPGRLERLASTPQDLRLHRPLATAMVTVTLAATLLQVPMQTNPRFALRARAAPATDAAPSGAAPGDAIDGRDRGGVAVRPDSTLAQAQGAASRRGSGAASVDSPEGAPTNSDDSRGARSAVSTEHAAAGGRDAGSTVDTAEDPGLSEAWRGEIVAQFRELSGSSQEPSHADAMLAADYDDRLAGEHAPDSGAMIEPAAAIAPEARDRRPLGPAERAYVRAYFADPGATP